MPQRALAVALRRVAVSAAAASCTMNLSTACAAGQYVIATDGLAKSSTESAKEFLLSRPSGAYTTARTCCGATRLFEWETHVTRTASSVAGMLQGEEQKSAAGALEALSKPELLRPRLDATVSSAVREYESLNGKDGELKVTILVTWGEAAGKADAETVGSIACHVAPLPALPLPPVRVEARGAPRANAEAKASSWVAERAPLEALMRQSAVGEVNELLLATESGEVLEGSQTNFFAVIDGAVHTAGDGVLAGTVRRLLLEVCEREGIPVVLRPPKLSEAPTWEGALISSTSRLLLPVDELYVPAEGAPSGEGDCRVRFDNAPSSLAAKLREAVLGEIEAHSSEISK